MTAVGAKARDTSMGGIRLTGPCHRNDACRGADILGGAGEVREGANGLAGTDAFGGANVRNGAGVS